MFKITNKKILKLLNKALAIALAVCLTGILLLQMFLEHYSSFLLRDASVHIFQIGLFIATSAIMSSLIINKTGE